MGYKKQFAQMTYGAVFEGRTLSHNESPFADSSYEHIVLYYKIHRYTIQLN